MRVLCVARHPFLSEHFERPFECLGADTSAMPVNAVSMTRRVNEAHLPDDRSVAGVFHLPTSDEDDARRALDRLRRDRSAAAPISGLTWPAPILSAQFR
jgi:hypothetical protein